jgi:hypothetical protein
VPRGVATAKQLAMMARVLEACCKHRAMPDDPEARDFLALEILSLFDHGFREEDALLAEMIKRHRQISN